jgi:outer membrane receptor protein involved in Fe transport
VYELQTGGSAGFDPGDCDTVSIFANRTPATQLDDFSKPLQDETGWSKWIGFSVEPFDNMSLQVDLSRIRLEDRVQLESLQDLFDDEYACLIGEITDAQRCAYVANRIERDIDPSTGVSFVTEFNASPVNASLDEVTSLDVTLNYRWDTKIGDFALRGEYTHTLDHTFQNNPGEDELDLRDDPINGGWDFRSIITGTLAWQKQDFSTALTMIRRGSTTLWRPLSSSAGFERLLDGNTRAGPYLTWNLTGSYNFTDKFSGRIRVQNLFDQSPPKDDSFLFYDYPWYNIYVYPGAGIGRELSAELNYRFD